MDEKYCPDCKKDLPLTEFTRNARQPDGFAFYCTPCRHARETASRRRRNGPPKHRGAFRPVSVPEGTKWCPECAQCKPFSEFPRNRSALNGLGAYCKPCHNKITRAYINSHGGARNYHFRRRYGITVEHFDAMFAEQNGLCAICREAPAAHVDHDHETNRVRGLLCFNCNGALGQFRDRTDLMQRAIAYLRPELFGALADHPAVTLTLSAYVGPSLDEVRPPAAG